MTIDSVREICRALPGVTEDIKWGDDLVFSVGEKMFAVVCVEPPHTVAFKCTPEAFAELVERDGVVPAPYLARAMWVQEREIGEALERGELEELIRTSYRLVVAKLPQSRPSKLSSGTNIGEADRRGRRRQRHAATMRAEARASGARRSRRAHVPSRRRRG